MVWKWNSDVGTGATPTFSAILIGNSLWYLTIEFWFCSQDIKPAELWEHWDKWQMLPATKDGTKLLQLSKEMKSRFFGFSSQLSGQTENLTTPSEPQHQHCLKPMRWGCETRDSKRFWFFWTHEWTDSWTHGRTDKKGGGRLRVLWSRC